MRRYLENSAWILAEKFTRLFIGLVVTLMVARYLGPDLFGVLAYAVSLTALLAVTGHMGLAGLVTRELVRDPDGQYETLGSSIALKAAGATLAFLALVALAFTTEVRGSVEQWVLLVTASSVLARPFDVVDYWFQSRVQARYVSIARLLGTGSAALFRVALVLLGAGVVAFSFAVVLQALVTVVALVVAYRWVAGEGIARWRPQLVRAQALFRDGWLVFLGTLLSLVYLKVDQVMLRWLGHDDQVGIYAIAATFSEAWYFVPTAVVASFFPRLIGLRDEDPAMFRKRLQQLLDALFVLACVVALPLSWLAEPLVVALLGDAYRAAGAILAIHAWAAVFVFMRAVVTKWILIEDQLVFTVVTQGLGAVANVALNLLLIPRFGGVGAAVATVISYATAGWIALVFSARSRPLFWMMARAMLAPVRYPIDLVRGVKA